MNSAVSVPWLATQPFFTIVVGSRGSGKSTLILNLLRGPLQGVFHHVLVISPTFDVDDKWRAFKLHPSKCFLEYSDELVEAIHNFSSKSTPCLLILDDCIGESQFRHIQAASSLNRIAIRGRHAGLSILVSSQHLTAIPPVCRENADNVLFLSPSSNLSVDSCWKNYGGTIDKKTFAKMIEASTSRKYGFMSIVNQNKAKGLPVYWNNTIAFDRDTKISPTTVENDSPESDSES